MLSHEIKNLRFFVIAISRKLRLWANPIRLVFSLSFCFLVDIKELVRVLCEYLCQLLKEIVGFILLLRDL